MKLRNFPVSFICLGLVCIFGILVFAIVKNNNQNKKSKEPSLAFGESTLLRGVNIGNALDAPNPGEWGVTIRPEYFAVIRKGGFNTVRLPVRFSAHTSSKPPHSIEPGFLAEVDEAVFTGLNNDLIIILDVHHYDEIMTDPVGQEQRFLAIWDQLSKHYQSQPDNL